MKIGQVLQQNQPEVHTKLKKKRCKIKKKAEKLSFNDLECMMKHDHYERHHGAVRQVK